jgi:membrane protease YdiL (CAAX protease family)
VLSCYNNWPVSGGARERWYPAINAAAAAALTAAAGLSGLGADKLGLRPGRLRSGVRWGGPPAAALAAGWMVVAAWPRTRPVLADRRITGLTWGQVGYQVLVRIPVGTVLWEEIAFRAVLEASLRRILPGPAAVAVTGGVFGVWHIRPTVAALRINQVAAGRPAGLAAVTAAVAGTALAGTALCWLRDRSGSVAAPVLVHLAANCAALLAARAATGSAATGSAAAGSAAAGSAAR